MSDTIDKVVKLGTDIEDKNSLREMAGNLTINTIANQYRQDENAFYDVKKRVDKIVNVASLITGTPGQNEASKLYDKTDFKNDSYLKEINYNHRGIVEQSRADNYIHNATFKGVSEKVEGLEYKGLNNYGQSTFVYDPTRSSLNNYSGLSNIDRDNIAKSGTYEVNGISYNASVNSNGTLSLSSFEQSFGETNNLKVNIDPLKGISSFSGSVPLSSLTKEQQDSIKNNNYFESNNIRYKADSSSITENGYVNVTGYARNKTQEDIMHRSFGTSTQSVKYEMHGNALSSNQIKDICNKGSYNLGGMNLSPTSFISSSKSSESRNNDYNLGGVKLSPTGGFSTEKYKMMYSRAANERANNLRDNWSNSKSNKAQVIADIKRTGINHIKNQDEWLDKNFNGSKDSVRRAKRHLDKEIKNATGERKNQLIHQKKLIEGYESHGGKIGNPNSKGRKIRGMRVVRQEILGNDMNRGLEFYLAGAKLAKTGFVATSGVKNKLSYVGNNAANKIIEKGSRTLSKYGVENRGLDFVKNRKDRIDKNYKNKKDKNQAIRDGRYKQYRRSVKDQKRMEKGDRIKGKIDKLDNRLRSVDKNSVRGRVLEQRKNRNQRRLDRFDKNSNFKKNWREVRQGFRDGVANFRDKISIRSNLRRLGGRIGRGAKSLGSRIARSRLGVRIGNSKIFKGAKILGKFGGSAISMPFKFLKGMFGVFGKIKMAIVGVVGQITITYVQFICVMLSPLITMYLISRFFSENPTEGFADRLNNAFNYQQLIVDSVSQELAMDYKYIAMVDATHHYLSKRQIPSEEYPWYVAPKFGVIANQWAWEESDNTSRYLTEADLEKPEEELYNDHGILVGSGDYIWNPQNPVEYGEVSGYPIDEFERTKYKKQSEREQISSVTFNLYPIVAMSHMRYHDEINFEQWETVLGYTYYMFAVSHDISRYDSDQSEYLRVKHHGDDTDDPGYDYILKDCTSDTLYVEGEPFKWDGEKHSISRSEEKCSNIYIHDFNGAGFTPKPESNFNVGSDKRDIYYVHGTDKSGSYSLQNASGGVFTSLKGNYRDLKQKLGEIANKLLNKEDNTVVDGLDKGYTDMNSALTLQFRKKALKNIKIEANSLKYSKEELEATIEKISSMSVGVDISKNESGVFVYDGTEESKPHAQLEQTPLNKDEKTGAPIELNGLGELCDNYEAMPYGVVTDTYKNQKVDLWTTEEGGICTHTHEKDCHLICEEEESEGYWVPDEFDPTEGYWIDGHTHGDECYDYENVYCDHKHSPWNSEDDPGCWKTVLICKGHCGSHLEPHVNLVQKVTYEGLAHDDNFKSTYWLTVQEIEHAAGNMDGGVFNFLNRIIGKDNIMTITKFRSYWIAQANKWFSPIPRSPLSVYKTVGKKYIMTRLKIIDGIIDTAYDIVQALFLGGDLSDPNESTMDNGTGNNKFYKENWQLSDETEMERAEGTEAEVEDKFQWDGWWIERNKFDMSLWDEATQMFGSWEEDKYKASEEFWKEEMSGEAHVEFTIVGIHGTVLTDAEIESILESILEGYVGEGLSLEDMTLSEPLTEKQKSILEAALRRVGRFSYSLTSDGHTNAVKNASGIGECSGFVHGVLNEALGGESEWNPNGLFTGANRFAQLGVKGLTPQPGDIISRPSVTPEGQKTGYNAHVMVYAGYQENGPSGPGHYVIDLSTDTGTSSYRLYPESRLKNYEYVYRP